MKKMIFSAFAIFAFSVMATCREIPINYDQLPAVARSYISSNFANDEVVLVTVDDDVIRPDYEVKLSSGVKLEFDNSGQLEKVSSRNGIPATLIPQEIRDYVTVRYKDVGYLEYEVGKKTYEVKLTNHFELKFNRNFHLVEVDR